MNDFAVEKGDWVAIMSPSGSGKTTLMNINGCVNHATGGAVILDGISLTDVDNQQLTEIRREKIGMAFQQFHLIPYLTAIENVMVAQYYHSMPDIDEAMAALKRVGLEDRATHLPSQLSDGEQQRVCIARALINYPVLILADEPTGNLDEANQNLVMKIFHELHEEAYMIITVTHSADVGNDSSQKSKPPDNKIDLSVAQDGTYTAESSRDEKLGYSKLTLTIENHKITDVQFEGVDLFGNAKDESYGSMLSEGDYKKVQVAVKAIGTYPKQLIETQDLRKVDAIYGASISYEQFVEATKKAVEEAA